MIVTVHSRQQFESLKAPDVPHVVVSINNPELDLPAKFDSNNMTLGRVNLYFWDLDEVPPGVEDPDNWKLFLREEADAVVDMLRKQGDCRHVIVHCSAGKSRSAGMAAAIMKCLNDDDTLIFNDRRYMPNMRVYRMMIDAWNNADVT